MTKNIEKTGLENVIDIGLELYGTKQAKSVDKFLDFLLQETKLCWHLYDDRTIDKEPSYWGNLYHDPGDELYKFILNNLEATIEDMLDQWPAPTLGYGIDLGLYWYAKFPLELTEDTRQKMAAIWQAQEIFSLFAHARVFGDRVLTIRANVEKSFFRLTLEQRIASVFTLTTAFLFYWYLCESVRNVAKQSLAKDENRAITTESPQQKLISFQRLFDDKFKLVQEGIKLFVGDKILHVVPKWLQQCAYIIITEVEDEEFDKLLKNSIIDELMRQVEGTAKPLGELTPAMKLHEQLERAGAYERLGQFDPRRARMLQTYLTTEKSAAVISKEEGLQNRAQAHQLIHSAMDIAFFTLPEQERAAYDNNPALALRTRAAQKTTAKSERIKEALDRRRSTETGKVVISATQREHVIAANKRRGQEIQEGTYTGKPHGRPRNNSTPNQL